MMMSEDEIHRRRMAPRWVVELAEKEKGTTPCFIMAKKLAESDLNPRSNRLLIYTDFVNANLIPFLSDEEKAAASLLDDGGRKRSGGGRGSKNHVGLPMPVYVGSSRWKAFVVLTRWKSVSYAVLTGVEYSTYLVSWSCIKKGQEVELWAFRQGERGRPCFVLHKINEDVEGI